MIMHEYASERRQQAERIRGLGPTFGMRAAGRKLVGAEYVWPVQVAVHAPAGFVGMGHWGGDECAANRGDWRPRA